MNCYNWMDVKVSCPYCKRISSFSLRLDNEEGDGIFTCKHRYCKKKFVLVYHAQVVYKTYKLVGTEIDRVAK